jgi:hypothetical protein
VDDGLRSERPALPLAEAAARLGISAEALCRRLDRGEARGFERDGISFVYIDALANEDSGIGNPGNRQAGDYGAGRRFGGAAEKPFPDMSKSERPAPEMPTDGTLPVVVEFQKMELTRLLRENERLNARLDQLFDEIRHLRDMQQREQVLRQQEQALRRQNQETLDRLTRQTALPPPQPPARPDSPDDHDDPENPKAPEVHEHHEQRPELVLTRTVGARRAPDKQGPGQYASGQYTPGKRILAKHPVAPDRRADGGIGPEEAAELAVILNDIGDSLRDSEAFRRYPPIQPGIVPQRAGDRRSTSPRPNNARLPGAQSGHAAAPHRPKKTAVETLSAEEAALAAILDSMGPTVADRRAAARNVRRLLRVPPRAGEH